MATASSIRITFNNAIRQADQLKECAEEMRRAATRMESIMSDLQREWGGDAATRYLAKCVAMQEKFNASAQNLDSVATAIRKAAQAYYDAEMRALEIINSRGSVGEAAKVGMNVIKNATGGGGGGGGGRGC